MTLSAAVDWLQSALRSNGAAIVNSNETYKIVPADQAHCDRQCTWAGQLGPGLQVVQLKYVSPSEMRRIQKPMAPRGGIVHADEARHIT